MAAATSSEYERVDFQRPSVQVGEGLAGGFQFGFEGGDLGGLLGARLFDDVVDRGGEVLVQFLGRAGDGGGRDREVAGQVGGALLEFGATIRRRRCR